MASYRPEQFINFDGIQQLQSELGRLFEGDWIKPAQQHGQRTRDWSPAVDMLQSDSAYTYLIDLPGVALDAVDVGIHRGELIIKGNRKSAAQADTLKRQERHSGAFNRTLQLEDDADEASVSASMDNGVLSITVKRSVQSAVRSVPVSRAN